MKSFICELSKYPVIGFDLDGTLYDEYEFVFQAYRLVSKTIHEYMESYHQVIDQEEILHSLCLEWLKVGSSAPIFQTIFAKYGFPEIPNETIKKCVEAFRSVQFKLHLSRRAEDILNYLIAQDKVLFLVTDGNSDLQRRKIDALGLRRWFSDERIAISGNCGREAQKPRTYMFEMLRQSVKNIDQAVYCGDRDVDAKFSANVGIQFMRVENMNLSYENKESKVGAV